MIAVIFVILVIWAICALIGTFGPAGIKAALIVGVAWFLAWLIIMPIVNHYNWTLKGFFMWFYSLNWFGS